MHPSAEGDLYKQRIERSKKELDINQRENLKLLDSAIKDLWKSLTNSNDGTIKNIYGKIVDEQTGTMPSPAQMNQRKAELKRAYMPYHNKLIYLVNTDLPETFHDYLKSQDISIKFLARDILESIEEFMSQQLTIDTDQNKFRLPVCMEKVQKVQFAINKFL